MSVSLVDLLTARRIIQSYKQTYSRHYADERARQEFLKTGVTPSVKHSGHYADEGAQQGHYVFALHAAFPLYFTPDLLYRLWQNFQTYTWQGKTCEIDPIAVSDFILSGMARETGYHLYEMAPGVRDILLQDLTAFSDGQAPLFTVERLHDIARFVQAYNEKHHLNPTHRSLYTALQWTAQSVLDPSFAAKSMAMALSESLQTSNEGETLRIAMLLDTFRQKGNAFDQVAQLGTAVQNKLLNKPVEQVVLRYSNGDDGNVEVVLPEGILEGKLSLVKHEKQVNKPDLYAVLIGIDQYANIQPLTLRGSVNDALAVDAYLKSIKNDFGLYEPHILIDEQASRISVINAFQHFKRAKSGDVCLFYFAGYGSSVRTDLFEVPEGELTTLVCCDSRSEGVFDLDDTEFHALLYEVLESKPALNFTVILDCSFYTSAIREEQFPHRSLPVFPGRRQIERYYGFDKNLYHYNPDTEKYTPPSIQKPYILLSACRSYEKAYETVNSNSKTVGLFTDTVLEILREQGRNITYSDLIHRTKLRISSQRQLSQVPNLFSNGPSNLEGLLFLSEKQSSETTYQIVYYADKTTQAWRLLAGARQGIRPSINFMFTYLTINELNGQKAIVKDVFEDYSTLLDFDEKDIDKVFTATLAQNALPKVKIAFDEKLAPDMRSAFEAAVAQHDIYYIDLIEKRHEARYLICNREREYYLACNSTDQQGAYLPVAPIFIYVRDPFDFIKQLEYIAQWRGLLEYDQTLSVLQRNQVALSFEVIEGVTLNATNLDTVEGKWISKPEVLELSYRKSKQPAFRCKVEAVRDQVYVSALFLSTSFGIQGSNKNQLLQASEPGPTGTSEHALFIELTLRDRLYKTIPIVMDKVFMEHNIKETYDFLKIFLSDKPIDLTPLLQESITFNEGITRSSLGLESSRAAFDLSGIDWTSITVPIKIISNDNKTALSQDPIKSLSQLVLNEENLLLDTAHPALIAELQTWLIELGLLDPSFSGDEKTSFLPTKASGQSMNLDVLTALFCFCRRMKMKFDEQHLTLDIAQLLLKGDTQDHFPLHLTPQSSDDPPTRLAKRILRYMQDNGYWIARSSEAYNIIYVEGLNEDGSLNDDRFDGWNDRRILLRILPSGEPEMVINDAATTEPGRYYTLNPLHPDGAARIAFGQYKAWQMGLHQDRQNALVQRGPLRVYRDKNKDGKRTNDSIEIGTTFGLNQHGTVEGQTPELVGRHSAGSFVGQSYPKHLAFIKKIEQDIRYQRNKDYLFVSTIIDGAALTQSQPNAPQDDKSLIAIQYFPSWPPLSYGEKPASILWHLEPAFSQLATARDRVWERLRNGTLSHKVRIAHIDVGYNPKHPIFKNNPNIRADLAKSFIKGEDDNPAIDLKNGGLEQQGHGTGTLALLSGWRIPELGYVGAVPFMEVIPMRISDTAALLESQAIVQAIHYAIEIGCEVICCAMAGKPDQDLAEAVNEAYEQGILMVFAAGNNYIKGWESLLPGSVLYPSRFPRVIAACGVCYNHLPYDLDAQAQYGKIRDVPRPETTEEAAQSNHGPASAMHYALAAYSPNIIWADEENMTLRTNGGGTSSATPQIAAAAALYLMYHRDEMEKKGYYQPKQQWKKVEAVRYALFSAADKSFAAYKTYYGNGIVKAWDALQLACPDIPESIKAATAEISGSGYTEALKTFFGW